MPTMRSCADQWRRLCHHSSSIIDRLALDVERELARLNEWLDRPEGRRETRGEKKANDAIARIGGHKDQGMWSGCDRRVWRWPSSVYRAP